MVDHRLAALICWLQQTIKEKDWSIVPITGDASFRRYFRVQFNSHSFIAMDAPPDKEDVRPFIAVAKALIKLDVQVPKIIAADIENGFLLLSDFGDEIYLKVLNNNSADELYRQALSTLQQIQRCTEVNDWIVPHFDQSFILREWNLFYQWQLQTHWQLSLTTHEQHLLANTLDFLSTEVLKQPLVCVHRDYHSRNLLLLENNGVGVLDFQDAVWGPITYDAVSLLRDCYIDWPREQVEAWAIHTYEQSRGIKQLKNISADHYMHWFDLLGIQRHLKAIGIFARLNYLYGRPSYLNYIPRTLNYILQVSESYPQLKEFRGFLENKICAQ